MSLSHALPAQPPGGSKWLAGLCSLAGVIAVGAADVAVGERWPVRLLQLVPVIAIARRCSPIDGVAAALLASGFVLVGLADHTPVVEAQRWGDAAICFGMLAAVAVVAGCWQRALDRQRILATRDALTGLGNRAQFLERATAELNRARRTARPLTVAFLDCDDFKAVNDSLGHLAGDQALIAVGRVLGENIRSYDLAARLGGDEFAVLLPETDAASAVAVVTRLQHQLQKAMQEGRWPITFSIGTVTYLSLPETAEALVAAADQAMYAAKRSGKGQVEFRVVEGEESGA